MENQDTVKPSLLVKVRSAMLMNAQEFLMEMSVTNNG
jgi:hypothetical protein